jgi:murein DD-endopeptidase MepM/ murein hydrolase activator NlpD
LNRLKSLATTKILWILSAAMVLMGSVFLGFNTIGLFSGPGDYASVDSVRRSEKEVNIPLTVYGQEVGDLCVVEDMVKRNQLFSDLLGHYFVSPDVQQQLVLLPRKTFDFRRIIAGSKYTLFVEQDSLRTIRALVYEPNPVDYVIFHFRDSLSVEVCKREVTTLEKNIAGEIQSSLSETIEELGISHELTNKFVDIFGWKVDFQRLQKGDKFKLIYEEVQVENKPIGAGKILGIYFEHFGSSYYAFPFDQGDGTDYFDENGQSLRKELLRYPIEFTHISSRYNLNRFHPIAKVFRAHLGTDFAAPAGTPIRTVGDGIIEEAQYKGGNGNYVKVRHNATYSTAYLHMSNIAEGMIPGARVKQGQTIGYVGSTGWATGPHVCYRFWRDGVQVDALKIELPPSFPVRKECMEKFRAVKEELVGKLGQISFPASAFRGVVAIR